MVGYYLTIINSWFRKLYDYSFWLCIQVYYNGYSHSQSEQTINVTNFAGTYTLDNLRPYTVYSVYVTAVRLIGDTGKLLEGMKSITLTERTLAGGETLQTCIYIM